jgi:DNA-binding beta-propeller fold protein YncE
VAHVVEERPAAPASASVAASGRPGHRRRWITASALALVLAGALAAGSAIAAGWGAAGALAPGGARLAGYGTGLVRVLPGSSRVWAGPSLPEVNSLAIGLGSLWLTGGQGKQNHVLYAVNPLTGRLDGRVDLPSRLVINPGDLATGSGAVWAAVGDSVYRISVPGPLARGADTRAFARLPDGGLIGDIAVADGAVWASDTTRGRVYRFAASTGRLQAVVPVGATVGALAAGDGGIWAADGFAHEVARISPARNRVDASVPVPGVPSQITATATALWVSTGAGGTVSAFDGTSRRAVTVRIGGELTGLAAAGGAVWVADTAQGTLARIDARRHTVAATVRVGTRPYAVAAGLGGVWVALLGQPVMVHPRVTSSSSGGLAAWLLRLCGEK